MSEIPLDLRYEPVMPADLTPGIGCIGAGFIMADCHLVAYPNAGAVEVEQKVVRLDVEVNHVLAVQRLNSLQNLQEDVINQIHG